MSNFAFLRAEWPEFHTAAVRAERLAHPDARASCFYARHALEIAVDWLYTHDQTLRVPYQSQLSALIHEPTFRKAVGPAIFSKARVIKDLGNQAVHTTKAVRQIDAFTAVRELFHVGFWLARTYARGAKPADRLAFNAELLPKTSPVPAQTLAQLQTLAAELTEKDAKLTAALSDKAALDEELQRLREEVAAAKAANAGEPDTHDYSEAETRDYFIDLLLREAGWPLDQPRDREFEVTGMPNKEGKGFVDYVLWGDDGKPLGLVEAKRAKRDARAGQQQAKLYADCLEKQFGQRPVIFYSNGYDHWIWDDASYPPRPVQGFLKKDELALLIQRRATRKSLADAPINGVIVERYYQTRAIRRIGEAFERDHDRKALVVMATGAGKTRTVIALCELLMRCNWVKRLLFLADRVALVNQAVNAFKLHLPDSSPVNLVTDKEAEGRVFVSTYPTMMGLIDDSRDGQRRFGVGHFDLVIVDEAHRSVYRKYGAIFDYFDSLLVGLTATPKGEIDRNTYRLFDLETGVPTDAYDLEDSVKDGFLVPARAVSVPLKFQRQGIRYDDLPDEEKEQWDALEWSDEGEVPDAVDAAVVNKWLFNKDTVDKVLEHLMIRGQKVAGGDLLGKTIIFAKNHAHANFIYDRFNIAYPHYNGQFAQVIDFTVSYAQTLIDSFSNLNRAPHIAISVDMLDTGIDIPEVVNLVFFKLVRSKTKFWQMVGRGTRLRPDLFGPGKDKQFFYIFDYCQNLEFFSQNPATVDGAGALSLGKQLFLARLELIDALDKKRGNIPGLKEGGDAEEELRHETADRLRTEVAAMNLDNFIVRTKRRLVEKYREAEAWKTLTSESLDELGHDVAGLPTELDPEDEEAKRFDLLVLKLELAMLRAEPAFARLRDQVKAIVGLLEEKASIPMVQQQLALIQEIQTDEWWWNVTVAMVDDVRKRLRLLIKLIDKQKRKPIYTDFEDVIGDETSVELGGFTPPDDYARFLSKARQFLRAHEDHVTVHKLRMNRALTPVDLAELERILAESGIGTAEDLSRAKRESNGLGLFVRSLVGLDRQAAKEAFAGFLGGKTPSANQIEFVNLVIDHLVEHGYMDAGLLYGSPYTDLNARGPDGMFSPAQVEELIGVLDQVKQRSAA